MNCAGIIRFTPATKEHPLLVDEPVYKEAVKRYGEDYVKNEMHIMLKPKVVEGTK